MGQNKMPTTVKNDLILNVSEYKMQIKTSSEARVFFALWPETSVRQTLHTLAREYQSQCEARTTGVDTLHMTLLFLGGIERECLPQLMQAAGQVSLPPFRFVLERLSFWLHNRIAYASPLEEVPALNQLAKALQKELIASGFLYENYEFIPHVTLLRHVGHVLESQAITPITWWVNSFVLVESVMTNLGTNYHVLKKWPLSSLPAPY